MILHRAPADGQRYCLTTGVEGVEGPLNDERAAPQDRPDVFSGLEELYVCQISYVVYLFSWKTISINHYLKNC